MSLSIGRRLPHVIADNRLGLYCIPRESLHRPCALTVLRGMVWEAATLAAIEKLYSGGDIVTAGTYFGDFLPFYGRLAAAQGARVLAFEPNPVNFLCAGVTRGLNQLTNCTLTEAGLGATRSRLQIKTHDDNGHPLGGGSRVVAGTQGTPNARFAEIAIETIDQAASGARVGLIQLDIEGHELAALEGGLATIARDRPLLVLEAHGGADFTATPLMQVLANEHGYRQIAEHDANRFFATES